MLDVKSIFTSNPAIGVIFSENDSGFRRRKTRKYKRALEIPSLSKIFWNFFARFETNLLCLKPRVSRMLFPRQAKSLDDYEELDSADDCFKDQAEPKYGFRVKLLLRRNEPCKLKSCLLHLNLATSQRRSSNVEFQADHSPECKIKNICG